MGIRPRTALAEEFISSAAIAPSFRGWPRRAVLAVVVQLLGIVSVEAQQAVQQPVTISSAVSIVESEHESASVRRASDDLAGDFVKVFGHAPRRVEHIEDAGPVAILIAEPGNLPAGVKCTTTTGSEAFAFSVASAGQGNAAKRVVCLSGADARGTIFAIYQFSQEYLGVDPMYLWTDKMPARRGAVTLPANFAREYPSPVFRYRGFFINDEDLLTGWVPAASGQHTGISLKTWDNIFETILRLKGNMIAPGSWIFPDDAPVEAASRRGLVVNQHHATPLGVNAARWPKNVPYNFSTHPEILQRAWKNAVAAYKPDDDILWSVGLRGLSDQAYTNLDPSVRNDKALLGKRISDAIAQQMAIVRARFPKAHFVTNLWDEGNELKRAGYLKIPPEVTQVWADTGSGDMQDGGHLEAGEGMYFHVAMQDGDANQLSEMVPVSVIQEELGRYIKASATGFFLLNTSDIRPVAMTTRAAMETAWGGTATVKPDADGTWYRRWATDEFGSKAADALAALYKEYFSAFIPVGKADDEEDEQASAVPRFYGEQHYFTEVSLLILNELSGNQVYRFIGQAPKWSMPRFIAPIQGDAIPARLAKDIADCEAAQPRWDRVWEHALSAESQIDPSRRNYYEAEVLTMIALNREGNRLLLNVAKAMRANLAGRPEEAKVEILQGLNTFGSMHQYMAAAEYGKWKNWYRGDWLTGVNRTQSYVQDYANHLADPLAPLPAPTLWNDWEAYLHIMAYEGNRAVDVQ